MVSLSSVRQGNRYLLAFFVTVVTVKSGSTFSLPMACASVIDIENPHHTVLHWVLDHELGILKTSSLQIQVSSVLMVEWVVEDPGGYQVALRRADLRKGKHLPLK